MIIVKTKKPSKSQIEKALRSCMGLYCQFHYECQTPRRVGFMAKLQEEDTSKAKPFKIVKCFIEGDKTTYPFQVSKAGETNLVIRPLTRKKKLPTGTGYYSKYGIIKGQNLWRSYRLEGIKLQTVKVNHGGKMVKVFPKCK